MPHLQSIRLEYGDAVEILAINIMEDGDPVRYIADAGYDFTLLLSGVSCALLGRRNSQKHCFSDNGPNGHYRRQRQAHWISARQGLRLPVAALISRHPDESSGPVDTQQRLTRSRCWSRRRHHQQSPYRQELRSRPAITR
jgi:hypothetical protein